MAAHNDLSIKIAEYVREHPGCKSAEIWTALTEGRRCYSSLAYAQQLNLVFAAGPPKCAAYYPDQFSAMENDDRLIREHKATVEANKKAKKARARQKRKQKLKAAQINPMKVEAKPAPKLILHSEISSECKITRAEPFVDRRYAPDPGWQGQITADWHERRLKEQHGLSTFSQDRTS
jgi:hypothetical protein